MQQIETRARLVGLEGDRLAARGPIAVLPRAEIEDAIAGGEYPARLMLDIARGDSEGGDDVVAEARVAVEWDRTELEELLRASSDDDVTLLSFDADELERLLAESDVDAHGLRERAAVLGIVVATAGATAGGALAHPQLSGEPYAGAGGTSVPSFITDSRGGDGGAAAAAEAVPIMTDSRGGTGGVDATPDAGGTSISLPSPAETAGVAGLALLITAAGFVAARSRRDRELPA
jgi:hypothetical protein